MIVNILKNRYLQGGNVKMNETLDFNKILALERLYPEITDNCRGINRNLIFHIAEIFNNLSEYLHKKNKTFYFRSCFICGGEKVPLHAHHVIHRSEGGINGRCIDLCPTCHTIIHEIDILHKQGTHRIQDSEIEKYKLSNKKLKRIIIIISFRKEYFEIIQNKVKT